MMWRRRRRDHVTFEDALERCLDAVLHGRVDIEACVAAYPQYADRLAPALKTALLIHRGMAAEPDPAFVQRTRTRLLAAAGGIRPVASTPARAPMRHATRWALATGMAAAVVGAVFMPALVFSSSGAIPGDWNYGVKVTSSGCASPSPSTTMTRCSFHLTLAERRGRRNWRGWWRPGARTRSSRSPAPTARSWPSRRNRCAGKHRRPPAK
ncbi:MAG: hypothetical protein U0531_08665 [Dehalococcoidia bacterium]